MRFTLFLLFASVSLYEPDLRNHSVIKRTKKPVFIIDKNGLFHMDITAVYY